ncbi:hypothetical protein [Dyadobacter sp. 32]|uniref:hypothetical protein n=1 Tax=Dyadobacter sp. 32 TaxID=538966 RepID=UPI0011EDA039
MSHFNDTAATLSSISDAGLFERLAASVLRSAEPGLYSNLTQPGINSKGKTVKAPLDAISFVKGSDPPHMVAVHHTICAQKDLRMKWLRSNTKVPTKQSNRKVLAPTGDLIKTIEIVAEERGRTPNLLVTLALTTNEEPPEDVTRDTEAIARKNGIQLDIWSRSRIAHYLDNNADGQWLRKKDLGIEHERLSYELLRLISIQSLKIHHPPLLKGTLIERDFTVVFANKLPQPVGFIVGESGYGKTVISYQFLQNHIKNGGCGLILSHELLAVSSTIDQAIDAALRKLHPALTLASGSVAMSLCSASRPLVLVIEDVNRSGQSSALIERLISWSAESKANNYSTDLSWSIICPVWPQLLAGLGEDARKRIESLSLHLGPYNLKDAKAALQRRAELEQFKLLEFDANDIVSSLGFDPLLIALYSLDNKSKPDQTIADFILRSTERLGSLPGMQSAYEYQMVLNSIAGKMVANKNVNPLWSDIVKWMQATDKELRLLNDLAKYGEIIRLLGQGNETHLVFRHDRVKKNILASSIVESLKSRSLSDSIFSDPFFADLIGASLTHELLSEHEIARAKVLNPLALFYTLQMIGESNNSVQKLVVESIHQWLDDPNSHSRRYQTLRQSALQILSETQCPQVVKIARKFEDRSWNKHVASLRNGDCLGGVLLCYSVGPGSNAVWRDNTIIHAYAKHGPSLLKVLIHLLGIEQISEVHRIGALRLAGHIGDTSLRDAAWLCWKADKNRSENIDEYIWTFSQCCGDEAEKFLGPVCDGWAELSDESRDNGLLSPRAAVAYNGLQRAVWKNLPKASLKYLIWRGQNDDTLRINLLTLLYGVDDVDAMDFITRESAKKAQEIEIKGWNWELPRTMVEYWQRQQQEGGCAMSQLSREHLQLLWENKTNDKYIRFHSFRLWAATILPSDLAILKERETSDLLFELVLQTLLKRGEKSAIPALIEKIRNANSQFWWQFARNIWSDELTRELDAELSRRDKAVKRQWNEHYFSDWITADLLMRLAPLKAEQLVVANWDHLRYSGEFIQVALFLATNTLLNYVQTTMAECASKPDMLKYITQRWGIKTINHPGITRIEQMNALVPYLEEIDEFSIYQFWDLCNDRAWFEFRKAHLDVRLTGKWRLAAGLDDESIFSELNQRLHFEKNFGLSHWVDRHIKNGLTLETIFSTARKWVQETKSTKALEFFSLIIAYIGDRNHAQILVEESDDSELACDIITDAKFAIDRRSLD